MARFVKNRKHVPYVPKLLPPQLAPEAITWGRSDKIIQLLKEDKPLAEIAALTGNRLSFVKRVVNWHLHPEDYEIPTPVLEPKPEIIEAPKPVKIPRQPKQKKSHVCYACATTEGKYWVNNGEIGSLCVRCYEWIQRIGRGGKPRNGQNAIIINCKTCSQPFKAYHTEIAKGKRYCSLACYHKARVILTPEEAKRRQIEANRLWKQRNPEKYGSTTVGVELKKL